MSTLSHHQQPPREMWAWLAISVIWLSVLADALFGPDIVTHESGGSGATIPSAVVFVLVAYFATRIIVRHGFDRREGV